VQTVANATAISLRRSRKNLDIHGSVGKGEHHPRAKRLTALADAINDLAVPTYIYHCGDYDPSGVNAAEKI
jgi:hypothetical protein